MQKPAASEGLRGMFVDGLGLTRLQIELGRSFSWRQDKGYAGDCVHELMVSA